MDKTTTNVLPGFTRGSANYHPSVWGNHFLAYASDSTEIDGMLKEKVEQLKEEVRKMIVTDTNNPSEKLNSVDAVQRLGVSYHFETEIEAALRHVYETYESDPNKDDDDLYTVSLRFRLLRQHGFPISCDVFKKFKDSQGNFQESLTRDVKGMLSLYEAAHLGLHGEDLLDEAMNFTTSHLQSMVPNLGNSLAAQVRHALDQALHRGMQRLEARYYMSFYEAEDTHNRVLLRFAKLDFNLLQKLYQKELGELTRWYEDLNIAKRLPFARDRLVESYFWGWAVSFEPQYSFSRKLTAKMTALFAFIDDCYDVYGTFEELVLFTEACQRWDVSALEQLPDYMQILYQACMDVFDRADKEIGEGYSYAVEYGRSSVKELAKALLEQAKWFLEGRVPSMEEYCRIGIISCYCKAIGTISYIGMGEAVTRQTFDWVCMDPLIVNSSCLLGRLVNDIASRKSEQERGHPPSSVECYMKQHGTTEEEAIHQVSKLAINLWKDINAELLRPTSVSIPILTRFLNLARTAYVAYNLGIDRFTHPQGAQKEWAIQAFKEPVPY